MQKNCAKDTPTPNFVVLTGIRRFEVYADDAVGAMNWLKGRIDDRRNRRKDPEIGVSLLQALDEGRLNFLVLDIGCTRLICGELNADGDRQHIGQFQQPVSWELAQKFKTMLPSHVMPKGPCGCGAC